jgi:hypothetical protein
MKNDGVVNVDVICGGAFKDFAPASNADAILAVDAREEIDLLPELRNLIKIPLGENDTILSMLERLGPSLPEAKELYEKYRDLPNAHLAAGMAQDPALGKLAIKDFELKGDLHLVFRDVLNRLLEASNGRMKLVRVRELSSAAGGMGSLGAGEIGGQLCAYIEHHTNAKVARQMFREGALSFATVAPRALENCGATSEVNLKTIGIPVSQRISDLEGYELPLRSESGAPIRDNVKLRNNLSTSLAIARFCPEVDGMIARRGVNEKAKPLGNILTGQAKFSRGLDRETLRRAAATDHAERLENLLATTAADLRIIFGIDVKLNAEEGVLPTLAELTDVLRKNDTQSPLLDRMQDPDPSPFKATVYAQVTPDQSVFLDEILRRPDRPMSLNDCRNAIARYRGILQHLKTAREKAVEEEAKARVALDKLRKKALAEIRRFRSARHHFENLLYSKSRMIKSRAAVFDAFLSAHHRHSQVVTEVSAIDNAIGFVERELKDYADTWVGRVIEKLHRFVGKSAVHTDWVEIKPVDERYIDLLEWTLGPKESAIDLVLDNSIGIVTIRGLMHMLSLEHESVEAIVQALVEETSYEYRAPHWGGETCYTEPRHSFVVLPPVSSSVRAAMERAAAERKFKAAISCADTLAGHCSIVSLDVYPVNAEEDLLCPIYSAKIDNVAFGNGKPIMADAQEEGIAKGELQ